MIDQAIGGGTGGARVMLARSGAAKTNGALVSTWGTPMSSDANAMLQCAPQVLEQQLRWSAIVQ